MEQIYKTLHYVHQFSNEGLLHQKERIINLLHSSLPSIQGASLKVRLRLYLKEDHEEIVRRQKSAFIDIFSYPILDLALIRSSLWKSFVLLILTSNNWECVAHLLGILFEKSFSLCQDGFELSPTEIQALSGLFYTPNHSVGYNPFLSSG